MEVSDTLLRSFKGRKMSNAEIARATGLSEETVRERVRRLYAAQNAKNFGSLLADPNELLIRLEASAIQLTWSPAEERQRRGCIADGVTPPDASYELCSLVSERCGPSLRWKSSRHRLA